MPYRDDSAGSYGTWSNNPDQSWLDYIGMKASDVGGAAGNALSNIGGAMSPVTTGRVPGIDRDVYQPQIPPMVSSVAQSFGNLIGTPNDPGSLYRLTGTELDAPVQQDMTNSLLSLYGGNALNPLAMRPRGALGAGMREAGEAQPTRAYHGTDADIKGPFRPTNQGGYSAFYATENPDFANHFASDARRSGKVYPLDVDTSGFADLSNAEHFAKIADALEGRLPEHLRGKGVAADMLRQRSNDGGPLDWAYRDGVGAIQDAGYSGTRLTDAYGEPSMAIFQPGHVKSATTGETLFSDTGRPSLAGSALAGAGDLPPAGAREFPISAATKYSSNVWPTKMHGLEDDRVLQHYGQDWVDSNPGEFGFVTNNNNFVNRKEAANLLRSIEPNYLAKSATSESFLLKNGQPVIPSGPNEMNVTKSIYFAEGDVGRAIAEATKSLEYYNKKLAETRPKTLSRIILGRGRHPNEVEPWVLDEAERYRNLVQGLKAHAEETYTTIGPEHITDKTGFLFSDTGKPSPVGAALASSSDLDRASSSAVTQPPYIEAYHGSPHDFDNFSLDKIGTGEGAQAYGHGLYFAENEGVARSYRDNLSDWPRSYDSINALIPHGNQTKGFRIFNDIMSAVGSTISKPRDYLKSYKIDNELLPAYEEAIRQAENPGRMYQVRINADPESFLDWDKPLSQQSEVVRRTLEPMKQRVLDEWGVGPEDGVADPDFPGVKSILTELEGDASSALREAGIPGIRYLDGNSRADGAGSSNYVVFDDSLIEIMKKYGLAGGVAGAGALSQPDQASAQDDLPPWLRY